MDRSKWNVRNNSWASNELSIDTSRPNNVFVSNGVLTLRAQRERYTAYSTTRDYTSGYLDTIGLLSRQYGRWEMRAKLPSAQGPVAGVLAARRTTRPGEVDILEAIGGLPQMTVQTVFPNTNDGSVKKSHVVNLRGGQRDLRLARVRVHLDADLDDVGHRRRDGVHRDLESTLPWVSTRPSRTR